MVAMATSLEDSTKNNFRLIIYGHSSTKPENLALALAKIDPVDFEIIGLTGMVKNKYKIIKK